MEDYRRGCCSRGCAGKEKPRAERNGMKIARTLETGSKKRKYFGMQAATPEVWYEETTFSDCRWCSGSRRFSPAQLASQSNLARRSDRRDPWFFDNDDDNDDDGDANSTAASYASARSQAAKRARWCCGWRMCSAEAASPLSLRWLSEGAQEPPRFSARL